MELIDLTKKLPRTKPAVKRSLSKINKIIIHHSAAPDTQTPLEIANYHIKSRGWRSIAYHIFICPDGTIYKCLNDSWCGLHTKGQNTSSIGILVVGNFDEHHPTAKALEALDYVLLRYRNAYPTIERIAFHRDYAKKSCPGKYFPEKYRWKRV